MTIHIVPQKELQQHNPTVYTCSCLPKVEAIQEGGFRVVHNLLDESLETDWIIVQLEE